jgi:hypothetical protein
MAPHALGSAGSPSLDASPVRTESSRGAIGRISTGDTPLPCAVQRVLAGSCQGCHAAKPGNLAPMALVTHEDLIAPAVSDPSLRVYQLVGRRIHAKHDAMPPSSSRRLTSQEIATIDAFVADSAPAASDDCADTPTTSTTEAHAAITPPSAHEIDRCYRLQVHDQPVAGDTTPYSVSSGEFYSCFYFDVPWPANSQALTVRSIDAPLTHHWMLYHVTEAYTPGQIIREADNCGLDVREVLGVHTAHSPDEQALPAGVGMQLPAPGPGHGLLLEVHYFNPDAPATDTSGAEVCTAKTPQPHVAAIGMLGADVFVLPPKQPTDLATECAPELDGDIHVLRSLPHMHSRGVALDTRIRRQDGSIDTLLDVPFDWNNQVMYDTPAIVHPGDSLLTTCHYVNDTDNAIFSGFGTGDEMCINFIYAWPAGFATCP